MRDFLTFRKMLTPIILQLLFWLSVILCIAAAVYNFLNSAFMHGLQILIIGPILTRIFFEFLIIFFRMNETLTELKNAVQEQY